MAFFTNRNLLRDHRLQFLQLLITPLHRLYFQLQILLPLTDKQLNKPTLLPEHPTPQIPNPNSLKTALSDPSLNQIPILLLPKPHFLQLELHQHDGQVMLVNLFLGMLGRVLGLYFVH